ncbi:hypothetical protein SRHO_G00075200 [Serrasalmus rhombeus]
MVEMKVVLKASSEKRNSTQVFPTPESPIRRSLKSRSYVFFAIVGFRKDWAVYSGAALGVDGFMVEFSSALQLLTPEVSLLSLKVSRERAEWDKV